jgi:hypothetical protein
MKQAEHGFSEIADFLFFNLLSRTAGNDSPCNSMFHPCPPFDRSAAATRSFSPFLNHVANVIMMPNQNAFTFFHFTSLFDILEHSE